MEYTSCHGDQNFEVAPRFFGQCVQCCCKWAIKIGDRRIEFLQISLKQMLVFWIIFGFAHLVHLYLNEAANKHNSWTWGTKIPNLPQNAPLRPSNYTVWCALATASIVGLVQLQQNVTSECHRTLVEDNIFHSDKKSVAPSMQCFYIKTQHEQALITASPPLPWLRYFYTLWRSILCTVVLGTTTTSWH